MGYQPLIFNGFTTGSNSGGGSVAVGGTITGGTAGSVLFVNPTNKIAQDNLNFNYDSTTHNLTVTGVLSGSNLSGTNTGDLTLGTANGLSLSGQALSLRLADTTHAGSLSSTDWNTFNGKQSALTFGNLTDVGTDGITISGGAGSVIGSGTSIAQHVADTTHNGYLSSADWNTFNGKQSSGNYITALTGDVSASGPGSVASILTTVNSNVGSFGSSTSIPSFTVNGKGLVTAASGNAVIAPAGTLSGTTLNSTVVNSSLTSLGTQSAALNMGSNKINAVTDPTLAQDAATKNYVDTQNTTNLANYLKKDGSVALTADWAVGSHKLTGLTDPGAAQDAATKNYVDTVASQLQPLQAVQAASTGNIAGTYLNGVSGIGATFITTSTSAFSLDGVSPAVVSRVLLKDQSSGFQNGVYTLTTQAVGGVSGATLTRALDYDTAIDIDAGDLIPVINGTVNANTSWLQTSTVTTVGSDSLVFAKWTANPANYLLKANNLSDVSSLSASFNNISPITTTGDLIYSSSGATNSRLGIGSTNQFLSVVGGLPSWQTLISTGDIVETSFSAANNQLAAANVTGFAFSNSVVRAFRALVSVYINATGSLYEVFDLQGIQMGSSWNLSPVSSGDSSGIVFSITSAGQIQYTSTNITGFTSNTIKFRATTTSV